MSKIFQNSVLISNNTPIRQTLTRQILPVFQLLRVFGKCPVKYSPTKIKTNLLTFEQVHFSEYGGYKKKLFLALSTFYICFLSFGLLQFGSFGFQLLEPGGIWADQILILNQSEIIIGKFANSVMRTFEIFFILHAIFEHIFVWWTTTQLIEWLNEWNHLNSEFELESTFTKFQKRFITYYTIFACFGLASFLAGIDVRPDKLVHTGVVLVYILLSTLSNFIEDGKCIILFKSIEIAFYQVRQQVKQENFYSFEDIRKWQRTILDLKSQAKKFGDLIATQQLLSILLSVYFSSASLYVSVVLIQAPYYGERIAESGGSYLGQYAFILGVASFAGTSMVRTLLKIRMAVRITEEESRIAVCIKAKQLLNMNKDCMGELKNFYDLLTHSPTEISLNGYVKLNNSLVLGIVGQIVTLFIVLMQFQSTK